LTTGGVLYMHGYGWTLMIVGFLSVLATNGRVGGAT